MFRNHQSIKTVLIFVLVFSMGLFAPAVWAHGGGTPRLTNTPVGPYWLSAWTQPEPPEAGEVHVSLALSEPAPTDATVQEAGAPVLNAQIEVIMQSLDEPDQVVRARATHDNALNKLFYEADLTLPQAGTWQVTVQVGEAGNTLGTANFELAVQPAPLLRLNWLLIGGIVLIVLVALALRKDFANTATTQLQ